MKILVNKIESKDLNEFGTDGYVLGQDGNFYSYQVEYGTNPGEMEEVAISDGCDRYVPVAIENVPDLIKVLVKCWNMHVQLLDAKTLEEEVMSEELEVYVDNSEVSFSA